jgi:hypothetical protein
MTVVGKIAFLLMANVSSHEAAPRDRRFSSFDKLRKRDHPRDRETEGISPSPKAM